MRRRAPDVALLKKRCCATCSYGGPVRDGAATVRSADGSELLVCANKAESPGRPTRIEPDGWCRNYRRRRRRTRRTPPPEPPNDEVRYIELTRGLYAIVDAADFEWLSRYKWQAIEVGPGRFYASRATPGRGRLAMHQAIMKPPPGMVVDHINGNGLDDRRGNMRNCTRAQNCQNRRPKPGAASPYKGVFPRPNGKFEASICHEGRKQHIGQFDDEIEAARAYDAKAKALHGQFAYLNFPDED